MESRSVEVGGEKRPFRMGIRASSMICEKYEIDLSEFDSFIEEVQSKIKIDAIVYLIYCGLYSGYKKEKRDIDFTLDDVWNWSEDAIEDGTFNKILGGGNEETPEAQE